MRRMRSQLCITSEYVEKDNSVAMVIVWYYLLLKLMSAFV